MELARVSSKGQITIPIEIRKKLKLKEGDKVLFAEENGNIFVLNASLVALKEIQENMKDGAEKQYLNSEEDVNDYVEKVREEKWEQKYENND
jgi:AbrB family looped-hinge helix DNA binding protein